MNAITLPMGRPLGRGLSALLVPLERAKPAAAVETLPAGTKARLDALEQECAALRAELAQLKEQQAADEAARATRARRLARLDELTLHERDNTRPRQAHVCAGRMPGAQPRTPWSTP